MFARMSRAFLAFLQGIGEALGLLVETVAWCRAVPRNLDKIALHMAEIGNATLPIASIMALFIGGVLSLQTATQLAKYGAAEIIGGIVGLSYARELGPVMTSLLVAGRVGSAMAAEVGSMSVYEEIDALKTLDIDPVRYLVMPRFVASVITLPVLVIYSNLLGWIGGAVVATANPKINVSFHTYFTNLEAFVEFEDILNGVAKALVFGMIIAIVCCYTGLKTTGGPREIGRSVTRAVVLSFIFIFIFDYVITRILL